MSLIHLKADKSACGYPVECRMLPLQEGFHVSYILVRFLKDCGNDVNVLAHR